MSSPPSASQNFEAWLEAYRSGHPWKLDGDYTFSYDDMFAAWVGGALFVANRMFDPGYPPPLPDIFREKDGN
jgi:hypothetical protein